MTDSDAATEPVPVLVGTAGWVDGELFVLKDGDAVVIGRSRSCDISLRRIVAYLDRSPGERDADHDFNTVSRRHLRLTVSGTTATLEDLSTNGSFCDDQGVEETTEATIGDDGLALRLGTRETFRLERASPERLEALRAQRDHVVAADRDDDALSEDDDRAAETV